MKTLLIEYQPFIVNREAIQESVDQNSGRLFVSGPIQRADALNQNGRVYPRPVLERVTRDYETLVRENRATGELDHPNSSIVSLQNVSHRIVEMWWQGNDLMGKIEVLPTPAGNILKTLFEAGVTIGISSRGIGSIKEVYKEEGSNPVKEVQDDFELICYDFVSNPSTHNAFLRPVNESINVEQLVKEYNYDKINTLFSQIICDVQGKCDLC